MAKKYSNEAFESGIRDGLRDNREQMVNLDASLDYVENSDCSPEYKAGYRIGIEGQDYDPTPWCHCCGAMHKAGCACGPYASNH